MYDDPRFLSLVECAHNDLTAQLAATGPFLGERLAEWIRSLAHPASAYFSDVRAFPILLLPWLAETQIQGKQSVAFQRTLAKSSMAAYYHVRLIDDIMDDPTTGRYDLLPALGVLCALFLEPYRTGLPSDDPVHTTFSRLWSDFAEITAASWAATDFNQAGFETGPGRKMLAARIPIELVLHVHRRHDVQPRWARFVHVLGRWHQMEDDLNDWSEDLQFKRASWFLSEAKRRAPSGIPVGAWILRNGLDWGYATLDAWWTDVTQAADELCCPGLDQYLTERQRLFRDRRSQLIASLARARELLQRKAP